MRSVSLRNICLKRKLKYICRKKGFYVKDHDQIHLSKKWFLSVSRHIWSFTDRRMFKIGILWIVQLIFKIRIILYLYMYKMVIETIDTIRLILLQSRIWIVRLKIVTQRFDFVRIFPINTYLTRIVCLLIVLIEANPDHFFFFCLIAYGLQFLQMHILIRFLSRSLLTFVSSCLRDVTVLFTSHLFKMTGMKDHRSQVICFMYFYGMWW